MRQIDPKQLNGMIVPRKSDKIISVFLLPSSSFYILTVAIALICFFILWAFLQESGDKSPWIYSGILASLIIIGAVVSREIIQRDLRAGRFAGRGIIAPGLEKLGGRAGRPVTGINNSANVKGSRSGGAGGVNSKRFTLQRNADFLKLIEQKSATARQFKIFPDKHLEVFELCGEYLKLTERELKRAELGTTKWGAFKNGRKKVKEVHRHHLISWAAVESRRLTQEAKTGGSFANKIETAQKAGTVLEKALAFYPDDRQLLDSVEAVSDFVASIKISHWIELAEKAAFKHEFKRAISHYKDALFYLARENVTTLDKEEIAEKINFEIKKMRKLKAKN